MLVQILFGVAMLGVTVLLQFILFKLKGDVSFWTGVEVIVILCVLGLLTDDADYLAGILGFMAGDHIGKLVGWHKPKDKA